MALQIIPAENAFGALTENAWYPNREVGADRLSAYPLVEHRPIFQLTRQSRIFTIGSCFALNIERNLSAMGIRPLSCEDASIEPDSRIKYTTRSILQDIKSAFDEASWMDTAYETPSGWRTMNFSPSMSKRDFTRLELEDLHARYFRNVQRLESADVAIVTLGLVECWFDRERQRYLNVAPRKSLSERYPRRFELHVLSYEDVITDLREIVKAITDFGCQNILLTVSPVPLAATFRGQDVLQANMYSKCVQRAAVEQLIIENSAVSYFPSFEMVMLADREVAYSTNDYRHVNAEFVGHIMRSVLTAYMDPQELAPSKQELRALIGNKDYAGVISRIDSYLARSNTDLASLPTFVSYYRGLAALRLKHTDAARSNLELVLKRRPSHRRAAMLLAELT